MPATISPELIQFWPAVVDQTVRLSLAGDAAAEALNALLAPHKTALLAIERQGQIIISAAVMGQSDNVLGMFRETKKTIKAVQIVASKLSYSHISKELTLLGIDDIPKMPKVGSAYLSKLNRDLRRSLKSDDLTPLQKAQRAGLAAVSAANRAYTDMQLAVYAAVEKAGGGHIEKVWTTNKHAATPPCAYCTALDGTVVALADEFEPPAGLKPYTDLHGPPAHANCRCRLIPRIVKS